jgi:hypothetical protein
MGTSAGDEFEQAARQGSRSLVGEFFAFLKQNKKWWLLPILAVLFVFGLLVFFSGSALAPFIYNLF